MRALVTGATGFAGAHLMVGAAAVRRRGSLRDLAVPAAGRPHPCRWTSPTLTPWWVCCEDLRPETIYHLAAFASPALSHKQPVEAVTSR